MNKTERAGAREDRPDHRLPPERPLPSLNGQLVRHDGQRIALASRSSWDGGSYELAANEELDVGAVARIVANLVATKQ